jgi:hypothetical protein
MFRSSAPQKADGFSKNQKIGRNKMTALKLHDGRRDIGVTKLPTEVPARTIAIAEPKAPGGVHVRWVDPSVAPHKRVAKHGEIKRLVTKFMIHFFTTRIDEDIRHEFLDIYQLQAVYGFKLGTWLGGLLGEEYHYVAPGQILGMLRSKEACVERCYFETSGDCIRLRTAAEGRQKATTNIVPADKK